MDALRVIDSLDSLWFFSNVLSPTTEQHDLLHANAEHAVVPFRKIEENKGNESPLARNLGRRCSNCGDFAPELQPQLHVVQQQPVRVERTKPGENRESRRRRRRRKRSLHESRKIGELDLGSDECSSLLLWETRSGFGSRHYVNMEMPPLNDGIAMKVHLKSWAQAVACTLR